MSNYSYYAPKGGLPNQGEMVGTKAVFKKAYALIPRDVQTDIVTSNLPGWTGARTWILARPLSGFAETFAQYIVELVVGGGSDHPEPDQTAQAILFVVEGQLSIEVDGQAHVMGEGGYAYIAPETQWRVTNNSNSRVVFHWIRKAYDPAQEVPHPVSFVTSDELTQPVSMPDTNDLWATTRFADPNDLSHDCHVNIVTFQPGGMIPFPETHVMEHGLYVLQGTAEYLLNEDWVSVEPGDFMWLRAFCPQACRATGTEPFRYLLYKDVNRHPKLRL